MTELTHLNDRGEAHMVDVGDKPSTRRSAIACGLISMNAAAFLQLQKGENRKGKILGVAQIAAIQAAKQTSVLIPLCHPLPLTHVSVWFESCAQTCSVTIWVKAQTFGQTGVEMEALTGVSVGLLTIYDMLKAVDKHMTISEVKLTEKQGGKSGPF